jgi:hypothetical protein
MLIKTDKKEKIALNPHVEGDDHDSCPGCGSEGHKVHTLGGRSRNGEEYKHATLYSCDIRHGGCGLPWDRTTRQGDEANRRKGIRTARLTRSAAANRKMFFPSDGYSNEYERIFGHG